MPILQAYAEIDGGVYVSPPAKPPRHNMLAFYVPKRNQYILYIYEKDPSLSISSALLQFYATTNYIRYMGTATNKDTWFTDQGVTAGYIFNITGAGESANNIKVNVLAVIAGTAIGTTEHLNETDFATHAKWDTSGTAADFDDTGGNCAYAYTGDGTSILTQTNANMAVQATDSTKYRIEYTVTVPVAINGTFTLVLSDGLPDGDVSLPYTAGTHIVEFTTSANASGHDFVITATMAAGVAGQITIDDISLVTAGEGEALQVDEDLTTEGYGASVTLAQDVAGFGIVYDIINGRIVKFKGMDILSAAVMSGGTQIHNLNLFLTSTGVINKYPDDNNGSYTTESAYIEKKIEKYKMDLLSIETKYTTDTEGKIDITVEDDTKGRSNNKEITIATTDNVLAQKQIPRNYAGNRAIIKYEELDEIEYFILNYIERVVR